MKTYFLIFFLLSSCFTLFSQDTTTQKKLKLNGYFKELNTISFGDLNSKWTIINMFHNRLNFKWYMTNNLTAKVEMRNRYIFGDFSLIPDLATSFEDDNGIICLNKNIVHESSFFLNSSIDRAFVDFNRGKFQFTLGRQRINWGLTFVWNPNDIFNTYSYFDFDYEEKPGSDAIRMQYYPGAASRWDIAVKANKDKKVTSAVLYSFNKWNYDLQFLGGMLDENHYVAGAGWSGQLAKGGLRGEVSYFRPVRKFEDTSGVVIASLGYDYTTKKSIFLQLEALYNGNQDSIGSFNLADFNSNSISPVNPFLAGYSIFGSIAYPLNPLINASIAGIYNPKNKIYILIPVLSFSINDDFDLSVIAQLFRFYDTNLENGNSVFLRFKWSF